MAMKVVLCSLIVIILIKVTLQTLQDDIAFRINDTTRGVVSRKRRYLAFPEGSSLQLVYCLTTPALGMNRIFTIGSTAALAWELPHDPFKSFRNPTAVLQRIDNPDKQSSGGWTLEKSSELRASPVSYTKIHSKPFPINKQPPSREYNTINGLSQRPTFYSIVQPPQSINMKNFDYNKRQWNTPGRIVASDPVTTYLHPVYHQVYRRTRRDLYSKLEKWFTALSREGRECLLKSVCEVSKASRQRGTFIEEIIKAIFRVKHHQDESKEGLDIYDTASNPQHNCTEQYPNCKHSIWKSMFP